MRRALTLALVLAAFGAGTAGAVLAAGSDAPIASVTRADAVGDSGSGPDISSLTLVVNADQTMTFSATLANRSSIRDTESLQFFIESPASSGELNISAFEYAAPELAVWTGTDWRGQHEIQGAWSNGTFTTTLSLGDLQDALQAPVRPALFVSVGSYVGATPGALPTIADAAPDTGFLGINTVATPATTTAPPPTETAPAPPPPKVVPTGARPRFAEKIVRLSRRRIEWKRLAILGIPARSRVSLRCTKGCKLSERPRVVSGTATSKRFVGVPLGRGATFSVEVVQPNKAGWWWRTAVVAKPAGQETSTSMGCIATDGTHVPLAGC